MSLIRYVLRRLALLVTEGLTAIVRILLSIVLLPLGLVVRFFECLWKLMNTKNLKEAVEPKGRHCPPPIPESVERRGDPAIYSQFYLRAQGLPVTWNNPDIWAARADAPNAVLPDSYHLQADTDYVVTVRVHNAATVPVFGVRVRLVYRPWSFNSPDLVPIETDGTGNEVYRFVNIRGLADPAYQPVTTTFRWHTPAVAPGTEKHYCIQAHLFHPMDLNPDNNLGQENTSVEGLNPRAFAPGDELVVRVPLFNRAMVPRQFNFDANRYVPDLDEKIVMRLEHAYGYAKGKLSSRIAGLVPEVRTLSARKTNVRFSGLRLGNIGIGRPSRLKLVRSRYAGLADYFERLRALDVSLPPGTVEVVDGPDLKMGVELRAREEREIAFRVKVPTSHPRGIPFTVNLMAQAEGRVTEGGITLAIPVI